MLPESLRDKNVCIVGLGYVGLTLAVAMADAGFRVHGVEISEEVLDALRHERGRPALLAEQVRAGRVPFGAGLQEAPAGTSAYIVTVGTPVGDDKRVRF